MARARAMETSVNVDMTPMIDVTFQLLIFFMMISVFNQMERAAEVVLPVALQASIEKVAPERMIVNITKDGGIILSGQRQTLAEFQRKLAKMSGFLKQFGRKTGKAPIVVRGHKECKFEHVRPVLAAICDEEFETIMFAAYEQDLSRKEAEP